MFTKHLLFFIVNFLIYFSLIKQVSAVSLSISNVSQTISEEPFVVKVTISGASPGVNFLRLDLFKNSGTDYFGETFNGKEWVSNSEYSNYLPVTILPGEDWSGEIQGRIGNPEVYQYSGPGDYKLKIRRYTQSGSYNSIESLNSAVDIGIAMIIYTPTPIVTDHLTATSTPGDASPSISSVFASLTPSINPHFSDKLYISEAMVNPETGNNEWVELYNDNDFKLTLNNWYLDDTANAASTPKKISLELGPKSYVAIDLTSSLFNNDLDSVRLLDQNTNEVDGFQYHRTEKGLTFGRESFTDDIFCLQSPSKNSVNHPCLESTPTVPGLKISLNPSPISLTPTIRPTVSASTSVFKAMLPVKLPSLKIKSVQDVDYTNLDRQDVLGETTDLQPDIRKNTFTLFQALLIVSVVLPFFAIVSILIKIRLRGR